MPSTPWGRRRAARDAALVEQATQAATDGVVKALTGAAAAATAGATVVDRSSIIPDTTGVATPVNGALGQWLTRDPGTFGSPLGPGYPLRPAAIDPLGPNGRPTPRLAQYDPARNLNLADRLVPFATLRAMADQCGILRRALEIRKATISALPWSFTLSPDLIRQIMADTGETNHARAALIGRERYAGQIDAMNDFWSRPDRLNGFTFSEWLYLFMEEHLVLDAVAIYPHQNLGGGLHSFEILDGSTIKPLLDRRGARPEPPAPAYQQILWGFPRGEFQDSDDPDDEFAADQLYYAVRNRRTFSPYGLPVVEQLLPAAALWLERQAWLRGEYTDSSLPQMFLKVTGESGAGTWTPDQREQFEIAINDDLAGQTARRLRLKLLPPGIEPDDFPRIDEKYKPEYDEFLIKQIASGVGVSPTQLGVIPRTGLAGKGQQDGEQQQAETVSLRPDIEWLTDVINEMSVRYLGMDRAITIQFDDDSGSIRSQVDQAKADQIAISTGWFTLNDQRAERGLPLFDMPEADEPMIVTASGPVFLKGALEAQLNPPEPPAPVVVAQHPGAQPADDGGTDEGATPADPTTAPDVDARKDEARKFTAYARRRAGRTWRDFTFHTLDAATAAAVNKAAAGGDLERARGLLLGKGTARRRPGHTAETRLLDHYGPLIATGLRALIDPQDVAHTWHEVHPVVKDTGDAAYQQMARGFLDQAATAPDQLAETLRALRSAAYVSGRATAAAQIDTAGGTVTSDLDTAAAAVDWAAWAPGDEAAAAQLAVTDPGAGLAALLDQVGITIRGITGTTLDRMSTVLADSLTTGASVEDTAAALAGIVDNPDRAYLIADTEMCRAVGVATLDAYTANGVEQKEWLTTDNACPECDTAEAEGPIDLSDSFDGVGVDAPPGHPACRCTLIPVVGD